MRNRSNAYWIQPLGNILMAGKAVFHGQFFPSIFSSLFYSSPLGVIPLLGLLTQFFITGLASTCSSFSDVISLLRVVFVEYMMSPHCMTSEDQFIQDMCPLHSEEMIAKAHLQQMAFKNAEILFHALNFNERDYDKNVP